MTLTPLSRLGILVHLDDESLHELSAFGSTQAFKENEVIIHEGSRQRRFYIVLSGTVDVSTSIHNKPVPLATLKKGDCFGEASIFQPGPNLATFRGQSQGALWHLSADELQTFFQENPYGGLALIWGINTVLSLRIQHANMILKANEIVPAFLSVRTEKKPT
jgi:CRP/FNR family transcriptional regulator, cyclic AMP receptor protein